VVEIFGVCTKRGAKDAHAWGAHNSFYHDALVASSSVRSPYSVKLSAKDSLWNSQQCAKNKWKDSMAKVR
jgi:hypothetical protein